MDTLRGVPEDISRWLADKAPHDSVEILFAAFCRDIIRFIAPVWRASLSLEVLHPEISGWQHVWIDENLSIQESDRANAATSPSYLNKPHPCGR